MKEHCLLNDMQEMTSTIREYETLLNEAAMLFRKYEESHRVRGPEHLAKAEVNADIAKRIEDTLSKQEDITKRIEAQKYFYGE